ITGKGNLTDIENAKKDMTKTLWSEIRNIMEIQLFFTLVFIAAGYCFYNDGISVHPQRLYENSKKFFMGNWDNFSALFCLFEIYKPAGSFWIIVCDGFGILYNHSFLNGVS
ncbi:MAG: exopolysaccharide Pel transporter PelG, partial [Actinobacteria bacterium]|nr:exopolysaccharide Pel transporter PelG [Actinomycetota bacterium]